MKRKRKLRKIGKVLHFSPIAPNILIIKTNAYLEPGTIVYNSQLEEIGIVVETFGPVNSPFARIKVSSDANNSNRIKDDVFIITGEKIRISWRKMPKQKRKRRFK